MNPANTNPQNNLLSRVTKRKTRDETSPLDEVASKSVRHDAKETGAQADRPNFEGNEDQVQRFTFSNPGSYNRSPLSYNSENESDSSLVITDFHDAKETGAQADRPNFEGNEDQVQRFTFSNPGSYNRSPLSYNSENEDVISEGFANVNLENQLATSSPVNFSAQASGSQNNSQLFRPESIRPSYQQPAGTDTGSTNHQPVSFSSILASTDKFRSPAK